jgi:hypothetical protein
MGSGKGSGRGLVGSSGFWYGSGRVWWDLLGSGGVPQRIPEGPPCGLPGGPPGDPPEESPRGSPGGPLRRNDPPGPPGRNDPPEESPRGSPGGSPRACGLPSEVVARVIPRRDPPRGSPPGDPPGDPPKSSLRPTWISSSGQGGSGRGRHKVAECILQVSQGSPRVGILGRLGEAYVLQSYLAKCVLVPRSFGCTGWAFCKVPGVLHGGPLEDLWRLLGGVLKLPWGGPWGSPLVWLHRVGVS